MYWTWQTNWAYFILKNREVINIPLICSMQRFIGTSAGRFYFQTRNEKLRRMIMQDRSHPSLIIYNLRNERGAEPQQQDYDQMRMAHHLDESGDHHV